MDLFAATLAQAAHVSWAIWPTIDLSQPLDDETDLSLPIEDPTLVSRLHVGAVIVGLNRSQEFHMDSVEARWKTFHTGPKHNDHVLAGAFVGTPLEGALMTDLVDFVEGKSANVAVAETDVRRLGALMASLASFDPVFIGVGTKVFMGLHRYRVALRQTLQEAADQAAKPCVGSSALREPRIVGVPHYSSQNHRGHFSHPATYRAKAHAALDQAFAADDWGDWSQGSLSRSGTL